ncbi:EAL domain-containing protein [Anaerovorax odorimutans]|uniref:EAL domain-containing protein n=1 Tax=Anaerovorax odorimutans TaxID=109327 RepID=A0ABT1RJ77_9FIRM|nr:EAL domain-containing protein [Anaerovorax odorimutans]MCQ4635218.1 EAL domain-containing protein [Anaerovorax odorimutans]
METGSENSVRLENAQKYGKYGPGIQDFYAMFQPLYSGDDGALWGFESLLRFYNTLTGAIPPETIIPIIEARGCALIAESVILRETTDLLKRIDALGQAAKGSINISPNQMRQRDLIPRLEEHMECEGLLKENLVLEITEDCYADADATVRFATEAKECGFSVSIDDFGKGYTSPEMILEVPSDIVKIDKDFIQKSRRSDYKRIVEPLAEYCRKAGILLCQEGVEEKRQLELCKELRIDIIQGFYYSEAVTANQLMKLAQCQERTEIT